LTYGGAQLTNSILTAVANTNGITFAAGVIQTSGSTVYQPIGAGYYYLATNALHGAGVTNINPLVLSDIRAKTTYPPLMYSNVVVSTNITLNPLARRDSSGNPDLGYHYDPIDYLVDGFTITNALLTVTNGTVVASLNSVSGIWLQDGSSMTSIGTANLPNWFVHYLCVQEQPIAIGSYIYSGTTILNFYHYGSTGYSGVFLFNKFSMPSGSSGYYFYDYSNWSLQSLLVQNCEMRDNKNLFNGGPGCSSVIKNNLFCRSGVSATVYAGDTNDALTVSNNLFFGARITFRPLASSNLWSAADNAFDTCIIAVISGAFTNSHNAYLNCQNRLTPTNAFDIVMSNSLAYQSGPLGDFYQPTNSPLINAGSTTADQVGLYHFTTQTNQVPETNSIVDIGYHYVATDQYGNPLDTNGDGIPDYLEDANGDGIFDVGDLGDWKISPYGLGGASGLQVFTPLK
jgi:hypothetical protein